jgi:hypothetical protein
MVKGPLAAKPQLDLENLIGSGRTVSCYSQKFGAGNGEKVASMDLRDEDTEESGFIVVGEKVSGMMSSHTAPNLAQHSYMTLKRNKKTKEGRANLFSLKTSRK